MELETGLNWLVMRGIYEYGDEPLSSIKVGNFLTTHVTIKF
jgi:hypothetical protein